MKIKFCFFFLFVLLFSIRANEIPDSNLNSKRKDPKEIYEQMTSDSLVQTFDKLGKKNEEISNNKDSVKTESTDRTDSGENSFESSWKFYFILLIFPVMLFLIFLMVSRGKKG